MIRDQQDRTIMIDGFNVLEAIHAHQVVSRKLNPTRTEETLTPGPEAFPTAQIHAVCDAEGETFEGRKDREFFGRRDKWLSYVRHPMSLLGDRSSWIVPGAKIGVCTAKLGHLVVSQELKTAFVP